MARTSNELPSRVGNANGFLQVKPDESGVQWTSLAGALVFRGTIAVAADFPTTASVSTGDVYRVTANVTDNDPSKTNTGQSFSSGDEIAWNGTGWTELGSTDIWTDSGSTVSTVNARDVQVSQNLLFDGQSARSVYENRNTTANTAGNSLTVQAGGATSGATDKAGGTLRLSGGISTGSTRSNVQILGCQQGSSGTADNAPDVIATFFRTGTASSVVNLGDVTGTTGIPLTNSFNVNSQAAGGFGSYRNTTANTAGNSLTVQASGATSGATDKNGGSLLLKPGISTGTGTSNVDVYNALAGTSGTADNTPAVVATFRGGSLGIGSTSVSNTSFRISKNLTGGATVYGTYQDGEIQSDATSFAYYNRTTANTAAASFTLPNLIHYGATQTTIGAGSTVDNQYGFAVFNSLTGATNNYAFHSNIASGTNRWNFFASGTADNAFAGSSSFGGTGVPNSTVDSNGSVGANIVSKTANYTLTASDYTVLVDASGGSRTITLPAASTATRRIYNVKKTDSSANTVTIDGNGSETIDGALTKVLLTQWQSVTIQTDGTSWFVL